MKLKMGNDDSDNRPRILCKKWTTSFKMSPKIFRWKRPRNFRKFFLQRWHIIILILVADFCIFTDTGEDSKLVHRRKRPKVDTLFSSLFFPTRPSDEYDSAQSRKNSRPLLDVFACIGIRTLQMTARLILKNFDNINENPSNEYSRKLIIFN